MRTAEDIISDYRKRGYEDDRIRALAASRSEPLRSEILALLGADNGLTQLILPLSQEEVPVEEMPPKGNMRKKKAKCRKKSLRNTAKTPMEEATAIESAVEQNEIAAGITVSEHGIKIEIEEEVSLRLDSMDIFNGNCLEDTAGEIWLPEIQYEESQVNTVNTMEYEYPEFSEGYIPPELTVIETVSHENEEDDGVIRFSPEYALTPDQQEQALEEQQNRMYYDLAKMLTANFAEYAQQLRSEESELVCEDFDDIARPADSMSHLVLGRSEDEPYVYMQELADQLRREETLHHALELQLQHESAGLAATQQEIARLNELNDALRHENCLCLRDIEQLQNQAEGRNRAISEQSAQIIRLNDLVGQLSSATDIFMAQNRHMEQNLAQKDELVSNLESLLTVKSSEMDNLREKFSIQNSKLEKLYEEKKSLEERVGGMEAMRRELNILKTETIPNLNHDKEEMVELVGMELQKATELEELASKRSRRLSYVMTFAAAACVLMILSPMLAWHGREQERLEQQADFNSRMAQAQSVTGALQSERNELRNRLQAVRAEFSQAKNEWEVTKAQFMERTNTGGDTRVATNNTGRNPFDLPPREMTNNGEDGHVNGFNGADEWLRRHPESLATNNDDHSLASSVDDFKTASVKRGEGLSQVLWRVYGSSSPEMVKYVSQLNGLKKDRRGNPLLRANQQLRLPQDIKTAMLNTN